MFRISDVAEQLGVNRQTVYYWITTGVTVQGTRHKLAARRVGKQFSIQQSQLEAFLDSLNRPPDATTSTAVSASVSPSGRRAVSARKKGRKALERALSRK